MEKWGPGQPEPSTCNDHPDKHFLPCQLMGLASSGSCQAPAAGEKSPIIPAMVERRASSDSRKACGSKHVPPSRMWAGGQAVRPVSRPAPCPASVIRALGSGSWHFSCNRPVGLSLPPVFVLGAMSPEGPSDSSLSSVTHLLSGCTPSFWEVKDQAASTCKAMGGAIRMVEGGEV